jgi:hypothetical protein
MLWLSDPSCGILYDEAFRHALKEALEKCVFSTEDVP